MHIDARWAVAPANDNALASPGEARARHAASLCATAVCANDNAAALRFTRRTARTTSRARVCSPPPAPPTTRVRT